MLDLDYVVTRLHQLWVPDVAAIWLESPNAHLGGATPVDVLRQRGAADVVHAIDAEAEGAYA
ncbi:MAG: MbcA/ParS/Xre antitoxin family protein [Candidatus Limnocylindria bacterium]|nr:MbcA/ParS/Xre antitoxin family protein [Candidatus Limnocylindria bacterium]